MPRAVLVTVAVVLQGTVAQCPQSCRATCVAPRCGPRCCSFWERRRKRTHRYLAAAANRTLPEWLKSCTKVVEKARGCATLWRRSRSTAAHVPPTVVLMTMYKGTAPVQLIRFLEYHLLLGVQHAVLLDNGCGNESLATQAAIKPYISTGLVTLLTHFRCTDMRTLKFEHHFRGGSSMVRQLSGMQGVPHGALVVGLDDDEFVVFSDPRMKYTRSPA